MVVAGLTGNCTPTITATTTITMTSVAITLSHFKDIQTFVFCVLGEGKRVPLHPPTTNSCYRNSGMRIQFLRPGPTAFAQAGWRPHRPVRSISLGLRGCRTLELLLIRAHFRISGQVNGLPYQNLGQIRYLGCQYMTHEPRQWNVAAVLSKGLNSLSND